MKMTCKPLVIFLLFLTHLSSGQDLPYAKEVVNKLASDSFRGRGYVGEGDQKAAEYIRSEFERLGLQSFGKSHVQKFTTPVNTFPGEMRLSIGGIRQIPGQDFLIEAGSPGIEGSFKTVRLGIEEILDRQKLVNKLRSSTGKFIVIPAYDRDDYTSEELRQVTDVIGFLKFHPDNPASGSVIITRDKLTWGASTTLHAKPSFTVKQGSLPDSIDRISVEVENRFIKKYTSQNVIGYVEGKRSDSVVVLVAHYDHLGMMGSETIFPGANDNASGIAMLLSLAGHYKTNRPEYRTIFIAFGGEELGLVGAKHFVENPLFELSKIKFLINFDISGTGDEGIQVVNGSVYRDHFDRLARINEELDLLEQVKIRGEACNSDHCMFHMKGVPCFFIYTLGGIQAYHDIYDRAETLPLTEFEDYFQLLIRFIGEL